MRPLKRKVSVTLDEDLIEKVRILAENDDRAFSQYINLVLKQHVSAKEKENDNANQKQQKPN